MKDRVLYSEKDDNAIVCFDGEYAEVKKSTARALAILRHLVVSEKSVKMKVECKNSEDIILSIEELISKLRSVNTCRVLLWINGIDREVKENWEGYRLGVRKMDNFEELKEKIHRSVLEGGVVSVIESSGLRFDISIR